MNPAHEIIILKEFVCQIKVQLKLRYRCSSGDDSAYMSSVPQMHVQFLQKCFVDRNSFMLNVF